MKQIVAIIPNDEILDAPIYMNESNTLHHYMLIRGFTTKYGLPPISVVEEFKIVEDGHILIEGWDDLAICWIKLPITMRQYENLLKCREFLSQFKYFEAQSWPDNDFYIYKTPPGYDGDIIDYFYEQIRARVFSKKLQMHPLK